MDDREAQLRKMQANSYGTMRKEARISLMKARIKDLAGPETAMQATFVPQMLAFLAMDQIQKAVERSIAIKAKEFRPYTNPLRKQIDAYCQWMSQSLEEPQLIAAFNAYLRNYDKRTESPQSLTLLKLEEDVQNQAPQADRELAARIKWATILISRCESYDQQMDKKLIEKVDARIERRKDWRLQNMKLVLLQWQKVVGDFKSSPQAKTGIEVLLASAVSYAKELFQERYVNKKQ